MKSQYEDKPKSLKFEEVKQNRRKFLQESHIAPLTHFVETLRVAERAKRPPSLEREHIPFFDPLDGGVKARCLFLFETPGGKAVESGFISRNNPDESAKTFFELNEEAELDRCLTASWNVVPWYLGDGKRIRAARVKDIKEGLEHLWSLLELLKDIQIIVLGGPQSPESQVRHRKLIPQPACVRHVAS